MASLRDESGKVVMRATVPTEIKTILTLVKSAGPRVHVAFEEGPQAQWLHDGLIDHAEGVLVCNVRGRSETTNKSDRIDADGLSELLRLGPLKSVFTERGGKHPKLCRWRRGRSARIATWRQRRSRAVGE